MDITKAVQAGLNNESSKTSADRRYVFNIVPAMAMFYGLAAML